jgi:ATP-binding cassette subfamily B protein/ATP-binding cassette subfamily C protein
MYLTKARMRLNIKLEKCFYEQLSTMDYETLENPEIQTMKERAAETFGGSIGVCDQLIALIGKVISILAISTIIATLNPLIIIIICITIYLNSIIIKRLNKQKFFYDQEVSKSNRKLWGFSYMLENFHFAKELRLFNATNLLVKKVVDNHEETNRISINFLKKKDVAGIFSSLINCVEQLILYIYLVLMVIKRNLGVGNMTIYLSAAGQFSAHLTEIVESYLQLSAKSLKIQELINFFNIPKKQINSGHLHPIFNGNSTIEFKGVSFKYPGSPNYVLNDLNLKIEGREKICIVGENGSGKSTFIKLLTRLYFPTKGEILLNGKNINEYDYLEYQRLFAPVFQDFCQYFLTLGENIVLADELNNEKLDNICVENRLATLVNKLPKGYDTQVDKWIDEEGFLPSGGEGQRIAISRACYHDGEIFLLDEPTAALDPMAEYEIYTQFNKMITDKCAVLITHRLSAVQLADKIAVFHNGSVVAYGTHKELYEKGGIYTEMFDKQAQFYRDETPNEN